MWSQFWSMQGSSGPCITLPHSELPNQLELKSDRPLSKAGLPWHNSRYCFWRTVPQAWQINGVHWSYTEIPVEETGFTALVGTACRHSVLGGTCGSLGAAHTRPIFSLLSSLKQADHKRLISGIEWDLTRWLSWLQNGQIRRPIWPPTTCLNVYPDACPTAGGGFPAPSLPSSPSYQHQGACHRGYVCPWVVPFSGWTPCYSAHRQCYCPGGYQ